MTLTATTLTREELRRVSRPLLVPEWAEAGAQERNLKEAEAETGAAGAGSAVASERGVQK